MAQRSRILLQSRRHGFNPWVRKIPWKRTWQPTSGFLPGESQGQRSLVGYSPRGRKKSDMTERLPFLPFTFKGRLKTGICEDGLSLLMLSFFSHVRLCEILWTIAHQAPLSLGFSRQEYWSGLPRPSPGDLPLPGIEPVSPAAPAVACRFFTTDPPGSPKSWQPCKWVQAFQGAKQHY